MVRCRARLHDACVSLRVHVEIDKQEKQDAAGSRVQYRGRKVPICTICKMSIAPAVFAPFSAAARRPERRRACRRACPRNTEKGHLIAIIALQLKSHARCCCCWCCRAALRLCWSQPSPPPPVACRLVGSDTRLSRPVARLIWGRGAADKHGRRGRPAWWPTGPTKSRECHEILAQLCW